MQKILEGDLSSKGYRFGLVVSRFNDFITSKLQEGAIDALLRTGSEASSIDIAKCPGAFELPLVAKKMASSGQYDAIICLGAVIRGSTPHFDYVCAEASKGIASVSLDSGLPVMFGVLTTDSVDQAIERAGSKAGNKGWQAAMNAVEMINLLKKL